MDDPSGPVPISAFDWKQAALTHRGHLPHVRQEGVAYFVTFRLADSMPAGRLQTWRLERDRWLTCNPPPHTPEQEREFRSLWTVRIENWLDAGHGSCLLRCPETQAIVEGVMRYGDGSMYGLGDYVIMPNHVHVLVRLSDGIELSDVTGIWKATSARRINRLLSRTGRLWQDESFDHVVRDEAALWRFVKYIRDNPRKLPPGSTRLGRGSLAIAE